VKILLDTQVALWAWTAPEKLPARMRVQIGSPENEVFFSQVSTWEIAIKHQLGKLPLPSAPETFLHRAIAESGFGYLNILDAAIFLLGRLPNLHRDPFDRMLIAHALAAHCHLATADEMLARYPVPLV
jgi:PIN domain nuclease of toxin-antitoxin system